MPFLFLVLSISLLLSFSLSHPIPSAKALLSLSPSTLLSSLTPNFHRPPLSPGISQTLSSDHLHLTLPPLRSSRILVRATLSQPSRILNVVLHPRCTKAPCPPDATYVIRLAAAVDSSARVRVLLSQTARNTTRVRLDLTLLEPALRTVAERCAGEKVCLADAVRKRCGRAWRMDRCGPDCVVDAMRRCQGEGRGIEGGAKLVVDLFLAAASLAVVIVFFAGTCVAIFALPGEVVAAVGHMTELFVKREGASEATFLG